MIELFSSFRIEMPTLFTRGLSSRLKFKLSSAETKLIYFVGITSLGLMGLMDEILVTRFQFKA